MRGSTALESANALFRRAQAPANAERLCSNIWDGVTATRSTRRWLHRGRAFAVAPNSFALDIPHVAFSTGEGICQRKAESSVSFSGARACARAGVASSQAKPLLATDPRHAGHRVPSDRAPALRPGTALRMQRCAWQKRPTPAVLPVAQAWRGRVWVRLRTRSLPRQISRAMQRNLRTCYS